MFNNLEEYIETVTARFNKPRRNLINEGLLKQDLVDALIDVATFVSITNSAEFIQASIEQAEILKNAAGDFVTDAAEIKAQADAILSNIVQERIATQTALARAETAANNADLGLIPKGSWNPATNTPALTATPNPVWVDGSYLDVSPVGGVTTFAGENFAIGQAVYPGDRLKKIGIQWSYIKASDLGLQTALGLKPTVKKHGLTLKYIEGEGFFLADRIGRYTWKVDKTGATQILKFVAKSIAASALEDGGISEDKLAADVLTKLNDFSIPAGSISKDKLDSELTAKINSSGFDIIESDDIYFAIRSQINQYSFAAFRNGEIFANLKANTVKVRSLDFPIQRQVVPNRLEQVISKDDNLLRGNQVTVKANAMYGALWTTLPSYLTPVAEIFNTSGVAIAVRRSPKLVIRGKKYMGTFSPNSSVPQIQDLGRVVDGANPSTSFRTAGDYYTAASETNAAMTISGISGFYRGDLLVFNGMAWVRVAAPVGTQDALPGDWWNVLTDGVFEAINYKAGQRIFMDGRQSTGGSGRAHYFNPSKYGEYFYAGDLDLSAPVFNANPSDFDVYTTNAGTYNSVNYLDGDYMIRRGGSYYKISEVQETIPNGGFALKTCINSSELEIRRADKSATLAVVDLDIRLTQAVRLVRFDKILIVGNSYATFDTQLQALVIGQGRTVTKSSYGGGKTFEISSMLEHRIRRGEDLQGFFYIFIADSNNIADLAQVFREDQRMLDMIGSDNPKYIFCTAPGERGVSYSVSEGKLLNDLDQVSSANTALYFLEGWYAQAYPNNHFQTRKCLHEYSKLSTKPDLQNPGFTEGQMALLGNWNAFHLYFNYDQVPFTAEQLAPNFKGFINHTTDMPTGGANYDYYLRGGSDATKAGNILAKIAGVWTEYSYDRAHKNVIGDAVIAQAIYNQFIVNQNF